MFLKNLAPPPHSNPVSAPANCYWVWITMKFLFLTSDLIEGRDIKSKYINTNTEFIPQPNYIKVAEEPGVDCGIRKNFGKICQFFQPVLTLGYLWAPTKRFSQAVWPAAL